MGSCLSASEQALNWRYHGGQLTLTLANYRGGGGEGVVVPDIDFYPSILIEVWLQSPSFEALRFDIDRAVQIRASVGRQNSKEA